MLLYQGYHGIKVVVSVIEYSWLVLYPENHKDIRKLAESLVYRSSLRLLYQVWWHRDRCRVVYKYIGSCIKCHNVVIVESSHVY